MPVMIDGAPEGDVVEADVTREAVDTMLGSLCELGVDRTGGVVGRHGSSSQRCPLALSVLQAVNSAAVLCSDPKPPRTPLISWRRVHFGRR